MAPRSITLPTDSNPSEKYKPSTAVGTLGKVLKTLLLSTPLVYGVYAFGSKVSVWAMPPAIQSRITESAVEGIFGPEQEDKKLLAGIDADMAAADANPIFLMNSLLCISMFVPMILIDKLKFR